MSTRVLKCANLSCGYHDRTVLADIDLGIAGGKITTLLGPNGSGKSTLLKTIIGEINPIKGDLIIDGKSVQKLSARERSQLVAFVPSEEKSEFPFLVREVVAMGRIPHSEGLFDNDEDRRITQEAMEKTECIHVADRPITNVSAGEVQRALIARALAQQAPFLLLDEPTSHMDPGHQVNFVRLIRQLAQSGLAILVALHDLNLAAHLGTDAVLLHNGGISAKGSADEVLNSKALDEAYATKFERLKGSDGVVRLSPQFTARV